MHNVICPLVSRDMHRAIRCVKSCLNQFPTTMKFSVVPIINSLNEEFIKEFSDWCEKEKIDYRITPSKGTPSAGKNQVLKFFQNSEYDGLSMVDGDDMYYPSATQQIERHLNHHPGTDAIIVKPSDQIQSFMADNSIRVGEGEFAILWGTNTVPLGYIYGPTKHSLFSDRNTASNLGGHVFYSKKLVNLIQYDEKQLLGEDLLLEFELLRLHQESKICFWLSFASDVQFLDRTKQANIQSVRNESHGEIYFERLTEKIQEILNVERSSFNELPVEFPNIILDYNSKVNWLREILSHKYS